MRYTPVLALLTLLLIAIPSINSAHSSLRQELVISNQGRVLASDNFANTIFFEYGAESGVLKPPWDKFRFDAGLSEVTVSTDQARTENYSMKFWVNNYSVGDSQHCKVLRWSDDAADHADAYYSAWFYFPTGFGITNWRNIFQWKDDNIQDGGRVMFNIMPQSDMEFNLWVNGLYQPDGTTKAYELTDKISDLMNQWVHIQVHIVRGSGYKVGDGTIEVWINNVQRFSSNAMGTYPISDTELDYQWGVGNYGSTNEPDDQTLYVDDVVASSEKVPETYEVVDK